MAEVSIAALQRKVRRIEIVSNRLVSEQMAGAYHSVFKGQGIEFEEVRPYVIGDDVRSIDWNVTARAGVPHVKRFREEREQTVFLLVDVSASCRFGTVGEFKSELMAELCSVLAFSTIANNDRVGLMLCSDHPELVLAPRKGRRHILRVVREVLGFKPSATGTDLGLALEQLRHVLHRRAVVFVMSDFLDINYEDKLASVRRRHDLIAVVVDDPLERELPNVGLLEVMDAESGESRLIDTGSARVRERYAEAQRERREARKQLMQRNEIDMIELRTGQPYAKDLVRFFRRRARRQRR